MGWIIGIFVLLLVIGMIYNGIQRFKQSSAARLKYFYFAIAITVIYSLFDEFYFDLLVFLLLPNIIYIVFALKRLIAQQIIKIQVEEWKKQDSPSFTLNEIQKMLKQPAQQILKKDTNRRRFNVYTIPYGRANTFLNYFEKTIDLEDVLFYSPKRSLDEVELREYGACLTNAGLYISHQFRPDSSKNSFLTNDFDIQFKGMCKAQLNKDTLTILYADLKIIQLSPLETTLPLSIIHELCNFVISNKYSLALYKGKIIDDNVTEGIDYKQAIDDADELFHQNLLDETRTQILNTTGTIGAFQDLNNQFGELKNNMNGRQGHGYAAEYGNGTIDKLKLKSVVNAGSQLENGRQIKNGADRIVNGQEIQTKYYDTPQLSVASSIENDQFIYLDKKGDPMPIEVPRDHYAKALEILQKKLDNNEIKNATKGPNAENYLKKGFLTLLQAHSVCVSGTIEGMCIDTINGAITSTYAGGISAVVSFAMNIWAGKNLEESLNESLKVGAKVVGRGTMIYVFTMQLTRPKFVNYFSTNMLKSNTSTMANISVSNPMLIASDKAAKQIRTSTLAKSSLGNRLQINKTTGKSVVGSGVILAFTFGPDIARVLVGRISPKQLFKNAALSATSIVSAAIGNTFMPVVGAIVGGAVGGFIAKNVLDQFIEDDAKEMYQILKEEFLDVVMLSNLTNKEFEEVIKLTFGNPELAHILRDMYAYGKSREYARTNLITNIVISILAKRKKISNRMIDQAIQEYIDVEYTVSESLA